MIPCPQLKMDNAIGNEEYSKTIEALLCTDRSLGKHWFFFSAINFFFSIIAILGNTLILIALHKESSHHPSSKLLFRCLAITDLLVGLISEPSIALNFASLLTEHRREELCFYSGSVATVSFTVFSAVSLLTMTTISVDRLLALLLGLRYRHIVTLRRVRALVFFFWIASTAFASTSFWKYMIPKSYNFILIVLCIVVSAFCYSKIFLTLRNHNNQVFQHQGQANFGGLNVARYRKTVSTAVWVEVTLVACYLPYSIVTAFVIISDGSSPFFLDIIWELSTTLVCLNSSLNPILYCWKIREVRQEVKTTIRQLLCLSN